MVLELQLDNLYLLEKALSTLRDGIAIVNKDFTIAYINKEAQYILQKKGHSLAKTGDHFFHFVSHQNLSKVRHFISLAFKGHTSTLTVNFIQIEEMPWFEITVYPIVDDTSLIHHVCIIAKNITDKVRLENQLEYQRQRERRRIIKATIDAQERERVEIGKELHDNINQTLTTVKLYNEIVHQEFPQSEKLLVKSITILNDVINEIRQLSKQLAGPSSHTLSLKDLIVDLVESINIMQTVHINFFHEGLEDLTLANDIKIGVYRIIQEQITNTLKHAKASRVFIEIVIKDNSLFLKIADNGIGFDVKDNKKGVGLINMISRSEALGGSIDIQSQPGKGCRLSLKLPV